MKVKLTIALVFFYTILSGQVFGNFKYKRVVFDTPERFSNTSVIAEHIILISATCKFDNRTIIVESEEKVHNLRMDGLKKFKFETKPEKFDEVWLKYENKGNLFHRSVFVFIKNKKIIQIQYRCAGKPYEVVYE